MGHARSVRPTPAPRTPHDDAWHAAAPDAVAARLATDAHDGLTAAEAVRRLAQDGPNELARGSGPSVLAVLAAQFRSVVVWVLVGAAVVAAALGETVDAVAIAAIVVLNAAIGFVQELRAERAVAALAKLTAPRARVVRDGHAAVVPAAEVVRGDVLVLDGGDVVAADARLLEAAALRTLEAPLTGESEPVEKAAEACPPDAPLADRRSMVFLGTSVASGAGRALVVATGMGTEVGGIAALLETASGGPTPLEKKLDQVGRRLLWACLAIVLVVVALGLARGTPPLELFLAGVSLAVAAIPEGLPAVVTVALALGVQRMARRRALVRHLPAVETLGSAEVVCTDKTGTLTVGEMTARRVVTADAVFQVGGEGYATDGDIVADGDRADVAALEPLLRAAAACNDAELVERDGAPAIAGDPTEGALLVLAAKGGVARETLELTMPVLGRLPFDSDRKRMTVVRLAGTGAVAFVKGAPEVVLARSTQVRHDGGRVEPLDAAARARLADASARLADGALRVLALAERPLARLPGREDPETGLTFLGLVGIQDPPRPEAREAVARCRAAGITTVMITGDHPATARAIGREVGILAEGDALLDGRALDALDDAALAERVRDVAVYARVTAAHKLRIVRAWKANGAVVAMTGDGVNDAPALKEASVGIAMGITGTEVTKEAAELVVTDDDFASIVAAVEEGRGIYDNIAKTLGYLLAGNAAELGVMLVAGLAGWPLPLLPAQLLWINLVTDGLPALGLATDPADRAVLTRPPRRADAALMDRAFLGRVAVTGGLIALVSLAAFAGEWLGGGSLAEARNAGFAVLVLAQLLRAFGARSDERTVWELGLRSHLRLAAIVAGTLGLQIAIHQSPVLQPYFGTLPLVWSDALVWTGLAAVPLVVLEVRKVVRRRTGGTAAVAPASSPAVAGAVAPSRRRPGSVAMALALAVGASGVAAAAPDGRALYAVHCARCHGAQAHGDGVDATLFAPPPPSLRTGVLAAHDDAALVERIRHGRPLALAPDALRRRADDTEALVAHLRRLPDLPWRRLERGQAIWAARCSPCHGAYGRAPAALPPGVTTTPRDLSDPGYQAAASDHELLGRVRHGHRAMPAIPGLGDGADREALLAYVRLLSPGHTRYARFCAGCHGDDGRGPGGDLALPRRPLVVFDAAWLARTDPEVLRRAVWHMLADATPRMPHLAPALDADAVRAVLGHLRALPAP